MVRRGGYSQRVTLVLDCKHIVEIQNPAPEIGDSQYCRTCNDYRTVDDAPPSYSIVCQTGRCTLSQSTRADRDKAFANARKHVMKMSRHKVLIFNGQRTVAEITNTEETLMVTSEERAAIVAEGQALLKSVGLGSTAAA